MTDRIDLDDRAQTDEPSGNDGDSVWHDDSGPDREPDATPSPIDEQRRDRSDTTGEESAASGTAATETEETDPADAPMPHVPKTGTRRPAGIPPAGDTSQSGETTPADTGSETLRPMGNASAAGPHGGGADDMTMAITYGAVCELARPDRVFADAIWADWIGIVGDVPAHVIGKFQRDHGIDADFFSGSGTDPGARLAEIDRNSMFSADRLVVVGREGVDEPIAEKADWEFVPLAEAASKADWELSDVQSE